MILTFIRHSKTLFEPNVEAVRWVLSDKGVELATELSANSKITSLDIIYCSDQNKALETAVILAKPNRIAIRVEHDLTELTSITNKFIPDDQSFESMVKDLHTGKVDRLNDGESIAEGLARFTACIEKIVALNSVCSNIGIVAHGNILSIFASVYEQRSSYEIHKVIQMPDIALFDWDKKEFISTFSNLS
jgi:broad specificity phosphatase PhoE